MAVTGRHNAQHFYGINKGWCAGHNTDAWAMTNPVGTGNESPQWSNWAMGGAWLVETFGITMTIPAIPNIFAIQPIR